MESFKKEKPVCIAFTGGGTGGHIYPGLAVVDALREVITCRVIWLGSSSGMDKNLVEKSGKCDLFVGVPSGKLRRYFSFKNLTDLVKIFFGFIKAFFVLKKEKPLFVFSKGGFVSVPPCYAAKLLGIPVYTHECDFSPGLATRLNSRVASQIFVSYESTKDYFEASFRNKIIVTGNPVRPAFYSANREKGLAFLKKENSNVSSFVETRPVLLFLGGSGGAKQINMLVKENLEWFCEKFIVVHQTGQFSENQDFYDDPIIQKYISSGVYLPFKFIYAEMPDVLACADIVFSRAGANSLWETAAVGKAMVLLPLSGSGTRGDQVENAKFFEKQNAALVISGSDEEIKQAMKEKLSSLLDESKRKLIAENASKLVGKENPAVKIAELLQKKMSEVV